MLIPADMRNAQSAEVHIIAARANRARAEMELNQAENFARLILNKQKQNEIMNGIQQVRRALLNKG